MSTVNDNQSDVLAEAERINEERMEIMRKLAESVDHRRELDRQVREAEKNEKRLIAEAEKTGWTRRQVQRVIKPPKQPRTQNSASTTHETQNLQEQETAVSTEGDHRNE